MAQAEDIFIPGKFTDLTDRQQLFLFNELLLQMLARINQIDPSSLAISSLIGGDARHVLQANGVGVAATWEDDVDCKSINCSDFGASQPAYADAGKTLQTIAWTGAVSFRNNLGLETDDSPIFSGLTIGVGGAGVDYNLDFNGETNDGRLTWMEDEDYFSSADDVMIPSGERIYFGDTGSSIRQDAVPALNIVDDDRISLFTPYVRLGQDLHVDPRLEFLGDHNDGIILWMEDENYFNLPALSTTLGFGCNGQTPQTSYASGGALAAYVDGAHGLDTAANMEALYDLVVNIRAALVANGIMS